MISCNRPRAQPPICARTASMPRSRRRTRSPTRRSRSSTECCRLDDRNFPRRVRTRSFAMIGPPISSSAREAWVGQTKRASGVAFTKQAALDLENDVILRQGDPIDVESESFGNGIIATGLRERALHGGRVRLLVSKRELDESPAEDATLRRLAQAGVTIRMRSTTEKFAVSSSSAWIGSANATGTWGGQGEQSDWGVRLTTPATVQSMRERFALEWKRATPIDLSSKKTDHHPRSDDVHINRESALEQIAKRFIRRRYAPHVLKHASALCSLSKPLCNLL